jgi:oleate hydratase
VHTSSVVVSLAAATYLIHDTLVPVAQIHIPEASTQSGSSIDGSGTPDTGYIMRGARMLNFSYRCLYDLLSARPSLTDAEATVMDEMKRFNAVPGNKTHANARIVKSPQAGGNVRPVLADTRKTLG